MSYTQLTQEQRYQISALLKTEQSQTEIAVVIGVNKSTIADLSGEEKIAPVHLAEALQYRPKLGVMQ